MKKLLIIFLVSVLYLIPGYSARFLFSELSITPDETNNKIKNIDSLFSLSSQYIATDNEIALLYIKKGKQLLDGVKYKQGILKYYLLMARIAYYDDAYETAIAYFDSIKPVINLYYSI